VKRRKNSVSVYRLLWLHCDVTANQVCMASNGNSMIFFNLAGQPASPRAVWRKFFLYVVAEILKFLTLSVVSIWKTYFRQEKNRKKITDLQNTVVSVELSGLERWMRKRRKNRYSEINRRNPVTRPWLMILQVCKNWTSYYSPALPSFLFRTKGHAAPVSLVRRT
jgi:hypothetical protein